MADLNLTIDLEYQEAMAGIDRLARSVNDKLKPITKPVLINIDSGKALDAINDLSGSFQKTTRETKQYESEIKNAMAALVASGEAGSKEFKALEKELNKVVLEAKKLDNAMAQVDNSMKSIEPKKSIFSSIGEKINTAGPLALAAAGTAVAAGLQQAIDKGMEYETSLAEFSQITGVQGKALQDFGQSARDLSKEFGTSAVDQINSFKGILSKLGPDIAKSPEALNKMAEAVNTLSLASGLDATASMDALTSSMLQFNVSLDDPKKAAGEMASMMNVLAAGAQAGAAEIPQVAEAINAAGVAASGAKLSFEETNAAIQSLATGGKVGAEAGTALRNVLGKLQDQSGEGDKALKKMGLTTKELGQILTTQGLGAALSKLKGGFDQLGTDAEKNVMLMTLFGQENSAAAGILLKNVDAMDKMRKQITGTNAAYDQASIKQETTAQKLARLKAVMEELMIKGFEALKPLIDFAIKLFDELSKATAAGAEGGLKQIGEVLQRLALRMAPLIEKSMPLLIKLTELSVMIMERHSDTLIKVIDAIGWLLDGILSLTGGMSTGNKETEKTGNQFNILKEIFLAFIDPIGTVIKAFEELKKGVTVLDAVGGFFGGLLQDMGLIDKQAQKTTKNVKEIKTATQLTAQEQTNLYGAIEGGAGKAAAATQNLKTTQASGATGADDNKKAQKSLADQLEEVKTKMAGLRLATNFSQDAYDKLAQKAKDLTDKLEAQKIAQNAVQLSLDLLNKSTLDIKDQFGIVDLEDPFINAIDPISKLNDKLGDLSLNAGKVKDEFWGLDDAAKDAISRQSKYADKLGETTKKGEGDAKDKTEKELSGVAKVYDTFSRNTMDSFDKLLTQGNVTFEKLGQSSLAALAQTAVNAIDLYLPQIWGASISFLGPIAGPIAAGVLTGLVKGLLNNAISKLGAEEGVVGIDGNFKGRASSRDTIPIWVHPGESLIPSEGTSKMGRYFSNKELLEKARQGYAIDNVVMDRLRLKNEVYIPTPTNNFDVVNELRNIKLQLSKTKLVDVNMYDRREILINDNRKVQVVTRNWGGR